MMELGKYCCILAWIAFKRSKEATTKPNYNLATKQLQKTTNQQAYCDGDLKIVSFESSMCKLCQMWVKTQEKHFFSSMECQNIKRK